MPAFGKCRVSIEINVPRALKYSRKRILAAFDYHFQEFAIIGVVLQATILNFYSIIL
jgi:hypothetical protein